MTCAANTATEDMASDNPSASITQRWPAVLCWTLAGLILAAIPAVIFPGDAPFVNDEPLLIMSALDSNQAHRLALHGLPGNRGLLYGPLPTWIYQVLLLITHDPIVLVAIHSAVLAAAILVPLFWLARDTRLWPPFALVIALSPQVWFQTRQLWDNTFNIPICAIALAAYVHFLAHRSRSGLAVAVAGLAMAPFVHPMAFAFVIPVALHIIIFERRALVENIWIVAPFPVLLFGLTGSFADGVEEPKKPSSRLTRSW
jgi:hypothetical protein